MDIPQIETLKLEANQSMEKIPKKLMDEIYGENYDKMKSSIKEMEHKTKEYFKDIQSILKEKFFLFNSNIENFFFELTNKYSRIFGLNNENIDPKIKKIIQSITKKYLDKIIQIKNLHEQILESIKVELVILFQSFDVSKDLENNKLINRFLEKEFDNTINSWLFNKLDFQNFNLIKALTNSKIDEEFKNYIYKLSKNKTFILHVNNTIKKDERQNAYIYPEMEPQKIKYFLETYQDLTNIKLKNIKNADIPFKAINEYPKLKKLKFKNCIFSNNDGKYNLVRNCSNLEKLIFNGTYNFEIIMLDNLSHNITKLILSNNNFINTDFNNIMNNYINKSNALKEKLEYLSFSNNNLTSIELSEELARFRSLKEIDFHKNKITELKINNPEFREEICINCCNNKMSRAIFNQFGNIVILFSGNIFLTDLEQCRSYYNYLQNKLSRNKGYITNLSISFLKNIFAEEYLGRININNAILCNIKKLDLSYNGLTCDILFRFLSNNKALINLKNLNLSGNKLNDTFFEMFIDNNYHNIFIKLQKINLNDNLIGDESTINSEDLGERPEIENSKVLSIFKLRLIYKFIEKNKNLSKLYLTKNPMSEKLGIKEDELMNIKDSKIKKDKQNNIAIDSFCSFLKKIYNELLVQKEEKGNRYRFNIKFDIDNRINLNSENYKMN